MKTCHGCGEVQANLSTCVECGGGVWRDGAWIATYTGRMFWPFDVKAEDFVLEDIGIPLARTCRFGGHCKEFYSVADHSVWVMERVPWELGPETRLAALLHDAAEAYLVDVPRPVKHGPGMQAYRAAEDRIQRMIFKVFRCEDAYDRHAAVIKELDNRALATEKRDLIVDGAGRWKGVEDIVPHPAPIEPTTSMKASGDRFMKAVKQLLKEC